MIIQYKRKNVQETILLSYTIITQIYLTHGLCEDGMNIFIGTFVCDNGKCKEKYKLCSPAYYAILYLFLQIFFMFQLLQTAFFNEICSNENMCASEINLSPCLSTRNRLNLVKARVNEKENDIKFTLYCTVRTQLMIFYICLESVEAIQIFERKNWSEEKKRRKTRKWRETTCE